MQKALEVAERSQELYIIVPLIYLHIVGPSSMWSVKINLNFLLNINFYDMRKLSNVLKQQS